MMLFTIKKKEKFMTNTEWKDLKVELVAVKGWMIFSACSEWVVEEDQVDKKDRRVLNQLQSKLRFLWLTYIMEKKFKLMSTDKESVPPVTVLEDLMLQLFRRVLLVREEVLELS